MILGDILLIVEGLAIILKCLLDFPPKVFGIYTVDCVFAIFATIFGVIMLVVGIRSIIPDIHHYISTKRAANNETKRRR
jgi:hypothetical protein